MPISGSGQLWYVTNPSSIPTARLVQFSLSSGERLTESLDEEMSIDADEVASLRLMHGGKFQWTLRLGKLKWLDMA